MQVQQQPPSLRNQTIETYIQRVTELSQLGQKIPSDEELNQIASELGITETEIISARKQSEAHYIRAQGYCNLRHWDDAIEELQEAVAFNPISLEMLHLLAVAHFGRWRDKHQWQDKQQIKMRIKQCLEINPAHEDSLHLLATLDKAQSQWQTQKIAIASALSIIIGSVIGYFWLNNTSFNPFIDQDAKLENLRTEFNQELNRLLEEQQILLNQLGEEYRQKDQYNLRKIQDLNQRIDTLQKQIMTINRENRYLQDKVTKLEQRQKKIFFPHPEHLR